MYSKRRLQEGATWNPIRLEIDYSRLDEKDDEYRCYTEDQLVTAFPNGAVPCSYEDVLTDQQITALKQTVENVKNYLQKLLKVIPSEEYDLQSLHDYQIEGVEGHITDKDMHFTLVSRPFPQGDSTVAAAIFTMVESTYKRPIQGIIVINPRTVPTTVADENTMEGNSQLFYTLVHEIIHGLGVAEIGFPNYHPHESTTTFQSSNELFCTISKDGKNFKYLTTPYAHKFAKKFYGVEEFVGDNNMKCKSGIEIEDGGGDGTAGSHPEARIYMTDLMVGLSIQGKYFTFDRLTEVTMALLLDSGNYKVDWKLGKPLVYGNPESIDGNPIPNFAIGPPPTTFPVHYLVNTTNGCQHNNCNGVGFNYKFFGASVYQSQTKKANDDYYQNAKKFFNPKDVDEIGIQDVYDFDRFVYPNNVCLDGKAFLPGVASCVPYTCNNYESFTITLETSNDHSTSEFTCTKDDVGKEKEYKYTVGQAYAMKKYTCVDPERFCRSVKLTEMNFVADPFEDASKQLPDAPTHSSGTSTGTETGSGGSSSGGGSTEGTESGSGTGGSGSGSGSGSGTGESGSGGSGTGGSGSGTEGTGSGGSETGSGSTGTGGSTETEETGKGGKESEKTEPTTETENTEEEEDDDDTPSDAKSGDGLTPGQIAGISIGVILLIAIIVAIIIIIFFIKCKPSSKDDEGDNKGAQDDDSGSGINI